MRDFTLANQIYNGVYYYQALKKKQTQNKQQTNQKQPQQLFGSLKEMNVLF